MNLFLTPHYLLDPVQIESFKEFLFRVMADIFDGGRHYLLQCMFLKVEHSRYYIH
jgi:hypothetical protein